MNNPIQKNSNAVSGLKKSVPLAAFGAVAVSSLLAGSASAKTIASVIVPDSDIHKQIADNGPDGRPATPGCRWSRLQVPTVMGLRWVAEEDCFTSAN